MKRYKYIYGPVPSWRLGSSLGIDLLSQKEKICNFDCIYCQLSRTKKYTESRKEYVSANKVIEEIKSLPPVKIDYFTFSGRGEPTLAKNLGESIEAVKKIRKEPVAVLTNSSLMTKKDVRGELLLADFVVAKLDACSQDSLDVMNNPEKNIKFENILDGIKEFRKEYKGKLGLQIMFLKENRDKAKELAKLSKEINLDEVQINTPLRACAVNPLSKEEILEIKEYFKGSNVVSVYDTEHIKVSPISTDDTLRRRGKII